MNKSHVKSLTTALLCDSTPRIMLLSRTVASKSRSKSIINRLKQSRDWKKCGNMLRYKNGQSVSGFARWKEYATIRLYGCDYRFAILDVYRFDERIRFAIPLRKVGGLTELPLLNTSPDETRLLLLSANELQSLHKTEDRLYSIEPPAKSIITHTLKFGVSTL